jgi:hypothetical protein
MTVAREISLQASIHPRALPERKWTSSAKIEGIPKKDATWAFEPRLGFAAFGEANANAARDLGTPS